MAGIVLRGGALDRRGAVRHDQQRDALEEVQRHERGDHRRDAQLHDHEAVEESHPDPQDQRDDEGGEEAEAVQDQPGEHHGAQAHGAADREVDVAGDHQQRECAAQSQDGHGAAQHVDHAVRAEEVPAPEQARPDPASPG